MQLDTLQRVALLLQKADFLTEEKIEAITSRLSRINLNKPWIYPTQIGRAINMNLNDVYRTLHLLEQNGLVRSYLEVKCPKCGHHIGTYQTYSEVPTSLLCMMCEYETEEIDDNTFVIYKEIAE